MHACIWVYAAAARPLAAPHPRGRMLLQATAHTTYMRIGAMRLYVWAMFLFCAVAPQVLST